MEMAVPLTFPSETAGVDQSGYRVEREAEVRSRPGRKQSDYREFLTWAGAILAANRWSANRVTEFIIAERVHIGVGLQLGSLNKDRFMVEKTRLRNTIADWYPGGAYARKKARQRSVSDW